jgi:hypothetical protein
LVAALLPIMTKILCICSLLALAACGLPPQPGQAPAAGTYNPVSHINNDG